MPKKSNKGGDQAKPSQEEREETNKVGINHLIIDRILEKCQKETGYGVSTVAFTALVLAAFNGGPVGREMIHGNGFDYFINEMTRYIKERMKFIKDGIYKTSYELNLHIPEKLSRNDALFTEFIEIIKNSNDQESAPINGRIKSLLEVCRQPEIERLENELMKLKSFKNSEKIKELKQRKMRDIELHMSSSGSINIKRVRELGVQLDNLSNEKSMLEDKSLSLFIDVMYKIIRFIEKFNEVQVLTQVDSDKLERLTSELEAINPDETVHSVTRNAFYEYTINLHHRVGTAYLNQSLGQASMPSATAQPSPADVNECELCQIKTGCDGAKLKKCKCRQVRYCSSECQRTDWPRHKQACSWYQAGFDLRHQDEGGEGPAASGPSRHHAPELDEEDDCVSSEIAVNPEEVD
jgi:hypothetical protein